MMKRNLGDALRARSAQGRAMEQLLRVITHNVMLLLPHFPRVETEPLRPRITPPCQRLENALAVASP